MQYDSVAQFCLVNLGALWYSIPGKVYVFASSGTHHRQPLPEQPQIIARTGCEDRLSTPVSSQPDRGSVVVTAGAKNKRGRHSSENLDENSQWGTDSSSSSTISPPTRLTRGISNEKQVFSPLSPHPSRRYPARFPPSSATHPRDNSARWQTWREVAEPFPRI